MSEKPQASGTLGISSIDSWSELFTSEFLDMSAWNL